MGSLNICSRLDSKVARKMMFGRPPHALDILTDELVVREMGGYLVGICGLWKDFFSLERSSKAIHRTIRSERRWLSTAEIYKHVEEYRWQNGWIWVLGDPSILPKLGDFLIGIPDTFMGGDWRDFFSLKGCCEAIDMQCICERDTIQKALYYKHVEEYDPESSD